MSPEVKSDMKFGFLDKMTRKQLLEYQKKIITRSLELGVLKRRINKLLGEK